MNKLKCFSSIFVCIVSVLLFLLMRYGSCAQKVIHKKLTVVATTSMIADAVRTIVRDKAVVHCLMGPGVDPHLYRARESDVHKLAAADIIFYNGLHLEGKMGQVLEGMNRFTTVIAVAQALDTNMLRKADFEGLYDPHIWFDISLWIQVVRYIQESVIKIDHENAEYYKHNSNAYVDILEKLHMYVQEQMCSIAQEKRILVTAHDAFGYFGLAYDCKVIGLQGLSTDSDISTKDIQELAAYIVEKKINAVFIETSIPDRSIVALQNAVKARGWSVSIGDELYSDSLGDETTHASDYCDMMRYNVESIVKSLSN